MPRLGWEVRATVERHPFRGEKDGHGPSPRPRHGLYRLHVDLVDVGAFLAVDLDVHEPLVHEGRDPWVLERLAFHDVAPVARRVADRQEDRHLAVARRNECLGAPWIPIDRVVRVLPEVGARLLIESVRHPLPRSGVGRLGCPRQNKCISTRPALGLARRGPAARVRASLCLVPRSEVHGSPANRCGLVAAFLSSHATPLPRRLPAAIS